MFIGFDTSNYTTSVATLKNGEARQSKRLLRVREGERGLRQSDAVFQHTQNIPALVEALDYSDIEAIGVSTRPRNVEGSYMPCFLVGESVARSMGAAFNVPVYSTSHQVGHILAALYSVDRLDLINTRFIAFHLSGGTTEALLVTPDKENIISAEIIAASTDLKAGQAIDRAGVMLGLEFPCGRELDLLSQQSQREYNIKPSMLGMNCSLSGVENKARKMYEQGESREDIARLVLSYVAQTVYSMLTQIKKEYCDMPVVFSGGVSSNSLLRKTIKEGFEAYFARPEHSLDNAVGTAVYAYLKSRG